MASLRDIRDRINSVKNTQKITSAMKMVAASKLRKAQESMLSARPYSHDMGVLLKRIAMRSPNSETKAAHPLLSANPEPRRILVVVITSDRGLCGGFNSNVLKAAERFIATQSDRCDTLEVATVGRRSAAYFRKRPVNSRDFEGVFDRLDYRRAMEIAEGVIADYIDGDLDAVYLIYNRFQSAIAQEVMTERLLPIDADTLVDGEMETQYIYEPSQEDVLHRLVPRYVSTLVWQALLESSAAEHAARMTAMDSASNSARDIVSDLTLIYNRARQAAITSELMEIISGAEALNA